MVRHGRRWFMVVLNWGVGRWGFLLQPPLWLNVTKCEMEFASPSSPELAQGIEHVRGMMACPSRSVGAWVTAAMFIGQLRWQSGGFSPALFRQELGLSSDFKILLIYDISTSVSPLPLWPPPTNTQQGDDDIRQNCLFVYFLLSPQTISFPLRTVFHRIRAKSFSCELLWWDVWSNN